MKCETIDQDIRIVKAVFRLFEATTQYLKNPEAYQQDIPQQICQDIVERPF